MRAPVFLLVLIALGVTACGEDADGPASSADPATTAPSLVDRLQGAGEACALSVDLGTRISRIPKPARDDRDGLWAYAASNRREAERTVEAARKIEGAGATRYAELVEGLADAWGVLATTEDPMGPQAGTEATALKAAVRKVDAYCAEVRSKAQN